MSHSELQSLITTASTAQVPERWTAFRKIGGYSVDESFSFLAGQLQNTDWRVRRIALESIARHAFSDRAADTICLLLSDPNAFVVRTACAAVESLHLYPAHDEVIRLCTDFDRETQIAALRTLAAVWTHGDEQFVIYIFVSTNDEEIKKAAAWTLHATANESTWQGLFDLWATDAIPRHRVWSCELVERFAESEKASLLEKFSTDDDGHVRKAAARAMK